MKKSKWISGNEHKVRLVRENESFRSLDGVWKASILFMPQSKQILMEMLVSVMSMSLYVRNGSANLSWHNIFVHIHKNMYSLKGKWKAFSQKSTVLIYSLHYIELSNLQLIIGEFFAKRHIHYSEERQTRFVTVCCRSVFKHPQRYLVEVLN